MLRKYENRHDSTNSQLGSNEAVPRAWPLRIVHTFIYLQDTAPPCL